MRKKREITWYVTMDGFIATIVIPDWSEGAVKIMIHAITVYTKNLEILIDLIGQKLKYQIKSNKLVLILFFSFSVSVCASSILLCLFEGS